MKRILSLALICIMLLSVLTLTSCQVYKTVDGFVKDKLQDWGVITRTTITREEWDANWYSNNFSLVYTHKDGFVEEILKTESSMKGYMGEQLIYFTTIDNTCYIVLEENGTWYAAEWGGMDLAEYILYDALDGDCYDIYDELEYDNSRQVYTWSDDELIAEFKFEDGALIIAVFENTKTGEKLTISNVGTTSFEIPEYTIYDPTTMAPGATAPQ